MLKPEILEVVFVAGSVLAGMTGHVWTKAPKPFAHERLIRVDLVRLAVPEYSGQRLIASKRPGKEGR